ncbi:hypothetical protein PORY_000431 [Pneumocystis oryctolagi]|uniref:Uncharacterized protein n=1 Tax=Pneumocystis oryctolagi TaxID=42067 RepID=A0ACB7CH05_9ASCO|nr:hypothetical protein PORY_000431 [Pneumocystis oryctolagi]
MRNIILLFIFPCISIYGFSVYDDILSRPRYQVKFKDIPISTQIANDRFLYNNNTRNYNVEYEILKLNNEKYFCTTPKVHYESTDNEKSETNLEKENESEKALENGLKLISSLENSCIYYLEGWWTYVLCYNKYVKQFHPLDWDGSQKSLRILENQSENYYLMGRFNTSIKKGTSIFSSKIEHNGDSYYISQRVGGGTYCNLIQENRHIEIQYICEPDTYDKIVFVAEISTCSYKMIVHTSKLCKEPFFNQLNNKDAHIINCERILDDNEYTKWMNTAFPKTINVYHSDTLFSEPHKYISMKKSFLKKSTQKSLHNYKDTKGKVSIKSDKGSKYSGEILKEKDQNYVLLFNYPIEAQEQSNNNKKKIISSVTTIYDSSVHTNVLNYRKKTRLRKIGKEILFSERKNSNETSIKTNTSNPEIDDCIYIMDFEKYHTLNLEVHDIIKEPNTITLQHDTESLEKLANICSSIQECLQLRFKYMKLSLQRHIDNPRHQNTWKIYPEDNQKFLLKKREMLSEDNEIKYRFERFGFFQIYASKNDMKANRPILSVPTIETFCADLKKIISASVHGPTKTFATERLTYLEERWNLYSLYHENEENMQVKNIFHRDFYSVKKVDTHLHHDASITQKHLVQFMKSKLEKSPNDVVLVQDGKYITLKDLFNSLNLTAHDLTVDLLNMHAYKNAFERFDIFNSNFNPFGRREFRVVFLSVDNYMKGKYFAELTREFINRLETNKYQMAECRLTNSGVSPNEWDSLAAWVIDNELFSPNVRWLIQVPRIYDIFKRNRYINNMEELLKNFFQPLFDVTYNPSRNPKLHIFLQRVVGFDSVNDESKPERELDPGLPYPANWNNLENPPYAYWLYYTFANLVTLNYWRKKRGLNTFVFRPHSGEAGNVDHLVCSFLTGYSINHGILLKTTPFMQYLYYLAQIGIAMSPISNNALFLRFHENPFPLFFKRGLNISLSTDDPVQFHFTDDPLLEEYSTASQVLRFSLHIRFVIYNRLDLEAVRCRHVRTRSQFCSPKRV